jgi:hypothetical protein
MDSNDDVPVTNAAFARSAIDDGTGRVLVESRCNRCGSRLLDHFVTIGRQESEHLLECIKVHPLVSGAYGAKQS